jgi:hypothetical protein
MRTATTIRLRPALVLVLLAWFAQLCLPVAHASMMSGSRSQMPAWCGSPSGAEAAAFLAGLPAELREAQATEGVSADHLAECAQLCATGSVPPPAPVASTVALRAAGIEPAPAPRAAPRPLDPALTPPAQGPPAHA